VVNAAFARLYFGSPQQAIDRVYNRDVRIVGVAADAHYGTPRAERQVRAVFVPYAPVQRPSMTHIVRVAGSPDSILGTLRSAIAGHDARLRPDITTAGDLLAAALSRERFFATLAAILAGLSILLASSGLYAAVGYAVSQRAAELSVRIALGASRRSIAALVLRGPVRTVLAGVLAGTPGVFFVMRSAESLLFGVAAFDPSIVAGSAVLLVIIGVVAAAGAARQATTIDPISVLKGC
jgi:putative ABC transport system permease protein